MALSDLNLFQYPRLNLNSTRWGHRWWCREQSHFLPRWSEEMKLAAGLLPMFIRWKNGLISSSPFDSMSVPVWETNPGHDRRELHWSSSNIRSHHSSIGTKTFHDSSIHNTAIFNYWIPTQTKSAAWSTVTLCLLWFKSWQQTCSRPVDRLKYCITLSRVPYICSRFRIDTVVSCVFNIRKGKMKDCTSTLYHCQIFQTLTSPQAEVEHQCLQGLEQKSEGIQTVLVENKDRTKTWWKGEGGRGLHVQFIPCQS